jgi:hypothetical protein
MRSISIAILTVISAMPSAADEMSVRLKQARGLDKVESNCGACHSLDYIPMNSPFLNAAGWEAEVAKMISAFGAPIDRADADVIAAYLKENYGMPALAPSPVSRPRAEVPVPIPRPTPQLTSGPGPKRIHFAAAPRWPWRFGLLWHWRR